MASGEQPIDLTSTRIQVAVTSTLVTTIGDLVLPVPPTMSDASYKVRQPKVTLGPKGLSSCIKIGSYAQLSVLQWAVNPYAGSKSIQSPLLGISSEIQTEEILPSGTILNQGRRSNTYRLPGIPAYTLSLQFSSPQNFDFEAGINYTSTSKSKSNYTIPACTQYDGEAYVPCQGCNISSYTNYNVTYSCFDISQICPQTNSKRRLDELNVDDDSDDLDFALDLVSATESAHLRRLQSTNDDGRATALTPATYGMLVQSIAGELSSVLSTNPFVRPSTAVLVFVGCLSGFIFLMLLCLLKHDKEEETKKNYLNIDIYAKARKLLEGDIRNGRSGDHSAMYEEYLATCKRESIKSNDIVSNIKRTSSYRAALGMRPLRVKTKPFDESQYPSVYKDAQYVDDNGSESCTDSDIDDLSDGKSHESEAAIIEFLHVLFPGHAIFTEKSSAFDFIAVNHDYFKTFGGSSMTRSRTIRFLELVVLVLVTLFVDTVFFGVFYPANTCEASTDEVSTNASNCGILTFASAAVSSLNTSICIMRCCISYNSCGLFPYFTLTVFCIRHPALLRSPKSNRRPPSATGVVRLHPALLHLHRVIQYSQFWLHC